MFKLSQKSDYGLILLSSFAAHSAEASRAKKDKEDKSSPKYISISSIASKHQISPKFLSQIAGELKKAGILISKEGISGGYTLAKKSTEIKVLDVLKILDGELVKGECFEDNHDCVCGAGDMWSEMRANMEEIIGKKTVADLVGG